MNIITLFRLKGLTDTEILEVLYSSEAKRVQQAYTQGFKHGVKSTIGVLADVSKYMKDEDEELAA